MLDTVYLGGLLANVSTTRVLDIGFLFLGDHDGSRGMLRLGDG